MCSRSILAGVVIGMCAAAASAQSPAAQEHVHILMGAAQSPQNDPPIPTVDNPNRFAVTGVGAARRFFELASSRRVDICLIGDSNGRLGASHSGHEDQMGRAFGARFGMYATRVDPAMSEGAWGAVTAGEASAETSPFVAAARTEVLPLLFPTTSFPRGFAYLGPAIVLGPSYSYGLVLLPDCPIDIAASLRYHLTFLSLGPASQGTIYVAAHPAWPDAVTMNYAAAGPFSTAERATGLADLAVDIDPGQRGPNGISITLADSIDGLGSSGPLNLLWQRVEDAGRTTGVSYSPLWLQGGKSARFALSEMQSYPIHDAMFEWFRQIGRLQNGPTVLLVHIMHGGNDINDYGPSLGPIGGLDSSTGPGHEDNLRGIINILRGWWVESGRDASNLFFMLGPYHPRPEVTRQLGMEQAGRNIALSDPQVFAMAGTMMSTPDEFAARGYLLNGDPYHLSAPGFSTWAGATIRALDAAICPADFNQDHVVDTQDIFDMINAWFAGDPRADFNQSGGTSTADLLDFIAAWLAGC
jgi:hypothetical protein